MRTLILVVTIALAPAVAFAQFVSGDIGVGMSIEASEVNSSIAADGYVLTADGAGGAAWEAIPASDGSSVGLADSPSVDGEYVLSRASGTNSWLGRKNNGLGFVAPTANDDSGDGYSVGSLWTGPAQAVYVNQLATVGSALWARLAVLSDSDTIPTVHGKSSAPTVDDDTGYAVGDLWYDVRAGQKQTYLLTDLASGAAEWTLVTTDPDELSWPTGTDGYVWTSDGAGGAAWEAAGGGGPTFVRSGTYDSTPQTCTGTYAQITGASAQTPTLGAGDMIRVDAVVELVANGDTQDVDFRLLLGALVLHERTAITSTGVYLLSGWIVVDSLGASGEVTGQTGTDETLDTTFDTTGPPSATVETKSTGSPPTSTVRVRSISLRHYAAQ